MFHFWESVLWWSLVTNMAIPLSSLSQLAAAANCIVWPWISQFSLCSNTNSVAFLFLTTELLFAGFGIFLFLFYSITPHVMRFSSAVVVNLSLLSADVYTLFIGLFLFHYKFSVFYISALILIIVGVLIYNIRQPGYALPKHRHSRAHGAADGNWGDSEMKGDEGLLESHASSLSLTLRSSQHIATPTLSGYGSIHDSSGRQHLNELSRTPSWEMLLSSYCTVFNMACTLYISNFQCCILKFPSLYACNDDSWLTLVIVLCILYRKVLIAIKIFQGIWPFWGPVPCNGHEILNPNQIQYCMLLWL